MDIHKAKPWHGLREFLKEYLIIVVGVLTALGGEQLVEASHWSRQTGEARHALGREFSIDIAYLDSNASQNDCMRVRLDRLEQWARGGPRPAGETLRPILFYLQTSTWNVINSGQITSHFPLGEQVRNAQLASILDNQIGIIVDERKTWMTISALASQPVPDEVERRSLRQAVGEARALLIRDENNAAIIRRALTPLVIKGELPLALAAGKPGVFCRAMGMEPPPSSSTGPARRR
jgi:hypothetical protein